MPDSGEMLLEPRDSGNMAAPDVVFAAGESLSEPAVTEKSESTVLSMSLRASEG